jgi:hypothetical protein
VLLFFRNNQITSLLPLALYVGLTHASALSGYTPAPTQVAGAGLLYQAWFGWAADAPFLSALAAAILVFVQALLTNVLADQFRLLSDRNWLPGVLYVLAASALPDFLFLSPPLVAATFVPMALRCIFKAYKVPRATALIFDTGFWIAVASLFYPTALLLFVAGFACINVMRSFNLREQLVFVTGTLAPLSLAWLWYFWGDRGGAFRAEHLADIFQFFNFDLLADPKTPLKTVFWGLLLAIFLFSFGSYFARKTIHLQKCITTLYWFLLVGGLSATLHPEWRWEHFLLPTAAAGIFLAMSFQDVRNRFVAEMLHLALLGFALFIQFFPQGN